MSLADAVGLGVGVSLGDGVADAVGLGGGDVAVADGLGVRSVPVVPAIPVVGVVLVALVVANLVGAYPAWRTAHLRTAVALRSE